MASSNRTHTGPTNRRAPAVARATGARSGKHEALKTILKKKAGAGKAGSTARTRLAKPAPTTVPRRKKTQRAPADAAQQEHRNARSTATARAAASPTTRKARAPSPAKVRTSSPTSRITSEGKHKVPASSPARKARSPKAAEVPASPTTRKARSPATAGVTAAPARMETLRHSPSAAVALSHSLASKVGSRDGFVLVHPENVKTGDSVEFVLRGENGPVSGVSIYILTPSKKLVVLTPDASGIARFTVEEKGRYALDCPSNGNRYFDSSKNSSTEFAHWYCHGLDALSRATRVKAKPASRETLARIQSYYGKEIDAAKKELSSATAKKRIWGSVTAALTLATLYGTYRAVWDASQVGVSSVAVFVFGAIFTGLIAGWPFTKFEENSRYQTVRKRHVSWLDEKKKIAEIGAKHGVFENSALDFERIASCAWSRLLDLIHSQDYNSRNDDKRNGKQMLRLITENETLVAGLLREVAVTLPSK